MKTNAEMALEITLAAIKARGEVISQASSHRGDYMKMYLSDEAIAETFNSVVKMIESSQAE
ncbi:hypothetical protein NST33_20795 [Paenibacillus sp. FSL L8-0435]|uniref:hypothetical protein n=1 Tax=Paenibacillus sp. FSL L8-0435 TaxID=2954618 RepID=UPI0030DB9110